MHLCDVVKAVVWFDLFGSDVWRLFRELTNTIHVVVKVRSDKHDDGVVLLQLADDHVAVAHLYRARTVRVVLLCLKR